MICTRETDDSRLTAFPAVQGHARTASGEPSERRAFLVEHTARPARSLYGDADTLDVPVVVSLRKRVMRRQSDRDRVKKRQGQGRPGDWERLHMVRIFSPSPIALRLQGEGLGAARKTNARGSRAVATQVIAAGDDVKTDLVELLLCGNVSGGAASASLCVVGGAPDLPEGYCGGRVTPI